VERIGSGELARMIQGAVDTVRAHHEHLSKLDSATGDGDHGAAMLRSVEAVAKALKDGADSAPKDLLYNIGWAVMSAAGGATGPLLGSLFVGLSEGLGEQADVDTAGLAGMFEAALASVQKQTKARPGDKTMMDALVPAVQAIRAAADAAGSAGGVEDALGQAADAALRGAESTRQMQAKFGKARNLGPRTIGQQDPGATSIAYLFRGFADGISTKG
jgi:dihydroxyacetone kinase-like protein